MGVNTNNSEMSLEHLYQGNEMENRRSNMGNDAEFEAGN